MADSRITEYTDLQGLAALRRDARAQDPAALREAARQFESVFTRMMLQSMRDASIGDPVFDSDESRFYRDMFDNQLAVEMSRGRGLGLAEMLVTQVMRSSLLPSDARQGSGSSAGLDDVPVGSVSEKPGARSAVTVASPTASTEVPPEAPARPKAATPTRQEFLDAVLPAAEKAAARLGVSPRNLIAQAALETGWGRSMPRDEDGRLSFNLFGIKATGGWRGASVASTTTEVLQGKAQRVVERFRAYDSIEDSVADHARLLGANRRYAAVRGTGDDAHAFGTALQRGGYATDPGYALKIAQVADSVGRLLDSRRATVVDAPADDQRLKVAVQPPLTVSDLRKVPGRT